jgi:hypothetical protein
MRVRTLAVADVFVKIDMATITVKSTDNTNLNTSHLPNFSGNWNNGDNAGVFQLNVNYTASNTNSNIGSQQMFMIDSPPFIRAGVQYTMP